MRSAKAFFENDLAGILTESEDGKEYRFRYNPGYSGPPISLTMPLREEELALPLNARKNKLKADDFLDYFAKDRLELPGRVIEKMVTNFANIRTKWEDLIEKSFLSNEMKTKYLKIMDDRFTRIFS